MALPHFGQPKASVYYDCDNCHTEINPHKIKRKDKNIYCQKCYRKKLIKKLFI